MAGKRLIVALVIQLTALTLFLSEFAGTVFDLPTLGISWGLHEFIELASIAGLAVGSMLTLAVLRQSQRRTARVEKQLRVASESFHSLMISEFDTWGLTPTERDTAILIVKGFSIAEMANLRNKSEGTIKAQNSSIYRKSGVSGRSQLVSHFIEELVAEL